VGGTERIHEVRIVASAHATSAIKSAMGLDEQRVPAGRYASTLHVGPYETLGDTWSRFMGEWLPSSGKRLADGVSYEVYENNPTTTPKEQLRTALYIPVAD
jgi:AraC family transcriptional regulator